MAESTTSHLQQNQFNLRLIPAMLLHPGQAFSQIGTERKRAWMAPLLILSLTTVLALLINGYFQSRSAMGAVPQLPPDWQYWSAEMQNDYMEAMQATQSPTIIYVIPVVFGLAKLWLGWVIVGGLLHLFSTLLGGRETITDSLNIYAFSILPFAIRDVLRISFVLISQHQIQKAGLSGFVVGNDAGSLFWSQILSGLDLFLVWHAVLLIVGFHLFANLPHKKAVIVVFAMLMISILAQAGIGAVSARVGAMLFPGSG